MQKFNERHCVSYFLFLPLSVGQTINVFFPHRTICVKYSQRYSHICFDLVCWKSSKTVRIGFILKIKNTQDFSKLCTSEIWKSSNQVSFIFRQLLADMGNKSILFFFFVKAWVFFFIYFLGAEVWKLESFEGDETRLHSSKIVK